jgi:hypothetical protein
LSQNTEIECKTAEEFSNQLATSHGYCSACYLSYVLYIVLLPLPDDGIVVEVEGEQLGQVPEGARLHGGQVVVAQVQELGSQIQDTYSNCRKGICKQSRNR